MDLKQLRERAFFLCDSCTVAKPVAELCEIHKYVLCEACYGKPINRMLRRKYGHFCEQVFDPFDQVGEIGPLRQELRSLHELLQSQRSLIKKLENEVQALRRVRKSLQAQLNRLREA